MDALCCVCKLVYGRIKAWKQNWAGYINNDVTAVKNNEDAH